MSTYGRAYLKVYGFNENGRCVDVKVITVSKDGLIHVEEAVGGQPKKENVGREKLEEQQTK